MRNTLLPIIVSVLLFIFGVSVLNVQLWYSARADSLSGARYVASDIDVILDEATHATSTASDIMRKGCDQEGQYRLGTEAALQPHLRTILIYREGKIWCSSLPGNRMLLSYLSEIPDTTLQLAPANNAVNRRPVLLYQNQLAGSRIVITISDQHIRDSLRTPLKEANYSLMVGKAILGLSGDVATVNDTGQEFGQVGSNVTPSQYVIIYRPCLACKDSSVRGWGC